LYKRHRGILGRSKVYRLMGRPHPRAWDAIELYDGHAGEGIVYVFRNNHPESRRRVTLSGLNESAAYKITYLDRNTSRTLTGRELLATGIPVDLSNPNTSEAIVITRVAG